MAKFYDMAVFPARARHPKDKALVENAVKLMCRSVYADIEGLVISTGGGALVADELGLAENLLIMQRCD